MVMSEGHTLLELTAEGDEVGRTPVAVTGSDVVLGRLKRGLRGMVMFASPLVEGPKHTDP